MAVRQELNKQEQIDAFKETIRSEGWDVYQTRIENIFQSATAKLLASTKDDLDENRGFYNCIKLVKELKDRIVQEK
jgi:hypothetical protein